MGIELMTSSLPRMRSTPELHRLTVCLGAENEVRTRDPQLGRLMLYQLSYFRLFLLKSFVGGGGLEPPNPEGADLQSAAIATMRTSQYVFRMLSGPFEPIEGFEPTTPRLQITCSGQLSYIGKCSNPSSSKGIAKIGDFLITTKIFQLFFHHQLQ